MPRTKNAKNTKNANTNKEELIIMNEEAKNNEQVTDIEAVEQELNNRILADVIASDKVQSELSLNLAYAKADTITKQNFLDVPIEQLNMVKGGLKKSVEAGSTLEYINAVLVNTMIKKTDSKEETKKLKQEIADTLGCNVNHVEKLVRVADKFITIDVPCNDVETITTKDGQETKTSIVKADYCTLLENITSAKVTPLSDKFGINFRVSAIIEFERLGKEEAMKLIKNGTLKASMSNSAIRDVVDRIKGTGKYKNVEGTGEGTGEGATGSTGAKEEAKTDKERLSIAIKMIEAMTTASIVEGDKFHEVLEILNAWSEIAK